MWWGFPLWRKYRHLLSGPSLPKNILIYYSVPEAESFDEIQTKVLRVFLPGIHSHLNSFALRFLFLFTHATSYSFYTWDIVNCKGEGGKPDRKPYPLPHGLRNLYRNLKSENS